jgi:hypothetical protein
VRHPPSPLQPRILDNLATLLTGAHPTTTAAARGIRSHVWNPYAVALPAAVRAFVHQQAQQLLHRHHRTEPVTLASGKAHRAVCQASTPPQSTVTSSPRLRHACRRRNGLHRISDATGLSNPHARLYAQLIDLPMPRAPVWDDLATLSTHEIRDCAALAHLHHNQ